MKKALISPEETPIMHITSYNGRLPVYSAYPNSCRIAQVALQEFDVALPLFWVDCADDVAEDKFYYDTVTAEILPIVNYQPATTGTVTA